MSTVCQSQGALPAAAGQRGAILQSGGRGTAGTRKGTAETAGTAGTREGHAGVGIGEDVSILAILPLNARIA